MNVNVSQLKTNTDFLREQESKVAKKKFRSLIFTLLSSPTVAGQLINTYYVMNNKKLSTAQGVYREYLYANLGINYAVHDELVKRHPKNHTHADIFAEKDILEAMLENKLSVDADPKAQHTMLQFAESMIESMEVYDEESFDNLCERASQLGKYKGQIILNHETNSDALIIQYILYVLQGRGYIPAGYRFRFIRGLHMAAAPDVRAFSVGFDALDIFGPKDHKKAFMKYYGKQRAQEAIIEELKQEYGDERERYFDKSELIDARATFDIFGETKLEQMQAHADTEINPRFPSGGRYTKKPENKGVADSDELHTGVKEMLELPGCIYLPSFIDGLKKFMHLGKPRLVKKVGYPKDARYFKKGHIRFRIGKPFIGGSICAHEANERLHSIRF